MDASSSVPRCLLFLLAALLSGVCLAQAAPPDKKHRSDRVLLKPRRDKPAAAVANAHAALGAKIHRQYPRIGGLQVVRLPPGISVKRAIEHYSRTKLFEYVEPDYEVRVLVAPNDPHFVNGLLYGLQKIDAPAAWDTRTDAQSVIVGVIDTGVRYTHEDLAANMWTNPGEIPGNSIDDDGNGYTDDVYGINAITGSGDPMDDHSHGSHVAGTIGAVGNNGVGVVGVAWRVQLMALKFLNSGGSGWTSDAIECIDYAIAKGAHILNNSWGCQGCFEQSMLDAINAARAAGIIFVAAAGNSLSDNDSVPFYPANYDPDNVVSVAATDSNDALAWFSNYGSASVHLGAPGASIYSTVHNNDSAYGYKSGTSMAAPHVAGALALLKAEYPTETYAQLIYRVLGGVDPVSALASKCVTEGRLNLAKALTNAPAPFARFAPHPAGGEPPLSVTFSNNSVNTVSNRWDFGDGSALSLETHPTHTYTAVGVHTVTLTVFGEGETSHTIASPVAVSKNYSMRATGFSWIDPSGMTSLYLSDDGVSPALALPFPFTFYDKAYSSLHVGANGLLGFALPGLNQYLNPNLPTAATPNTALYPFWDDLNPEDGGEISYGVVGSAPNRTFVVTWLNVPHYHDMYLAFSFQALLREGSNDIVFQYLNVEPDDWSFGAGRSATVGVENQTGSLARKYSFDGSLLLTNNRAILFTKSPVAPATPQLYYALAVATNRIDLGWSSAAGATGYTVRRNGTQLVTTSATTYLDTGLAPDTTHCYTVAATNAEASSPQSAEACATTLSVPTFVMDGDVDFAGYLQSSPGMKLYAAVRGQTLYVATQSPGEDGPNDHFIFVTDQLLPTASAAAPWAKAGLVAAPSPKPLLAGESKDDTKSPDEIVGWYIDDNAPNPLQFAAKSQTETGWMEGTLDLVTVFGYLPPTIYVAAAAYSTDDGGELVAQAPAGNGDGNIDRDEFLALATVALLDNNRDGVYDRLDPEIGFVLTDAAPNTEEGGFDIVWACVPGRTYQVQYSDSLDGGVWTNLGPPRTAEIGQILMSYTDTSANGAARRFYRVKLVP